VARVTLQTIADTVGVSRMTVSNAFSRPDQLSVELRRTIMAAAEKLGYVGPDPAARALARGTTGAVGVLLTESLGEAFSDPIAAGFFGALAEELAPTGWALSLLPSIGSVESIPARDIPMDGALVYACAGDTAAVDWLVRRHLPLVFVDQAPVAGGSSVLLDERAGSRQAAQHLLDLGHRRIALLALSSTGHRGVVAEPDAAGSGYTSRERVVGWFEPLGDADGVEITAIDVPVNSEPEAYAAAHELLIAPDRPTGFLCYSDVMAWGVLRAAQDLGFRVPADVSVVGFDDSPLALRMRPALTTVRQDLAAKGRAAALALTAAIVRDRNGSDAVPERIVLPTELVVRESTGPAPAPAPEA
jgi:DNA-binding LacI/PurR family transcriptional regulator